MDSFSGFNSFGNQSNSTNTVATLSKGFQGGLVSGSQEIQNTLSSSFVYDVQYEIIHYREGEVLFKEGETPRGLYLLKTGCVKLVVNRTQNRGRTTTPEYVTKLVAPGEMFGYKSLVRGGAHKLHAVAIKPTTVWLYPKEAIFDALQAVSPLLRNIIEQAVADIENFENTSQLHYLASVQERIAHQMLVLADRFGTPVRDGISLNLKLTRNEFAQLASTINESLSRHLTEFKNEGIIELNGKEIIIKNKEALLKKSGNLHS